MIIEWAESAEWDLGDIYEFIARDAPYYAEQFIDRVIEAVARLPEQPMMGRVVPEAKQDDIRELIFHNYRILYRLQSDQLYVVAVIHGSRDLGRMDTKPWEIV